MKINDTIVTVKERTIMYSEMLDAFVEIQENYDYSDFSDYAENPIDYLSIDYYMPCDWVHVTKTNGVLYNLKELVSSSLEKASRVERKEFFEKVISELVDIEYMENSTLQEIFHDEIEPSDLLDYLSSLSFLINKYTNKTMLPIDVYTHSESRFSVGNTYSYAFIIVPNELVQGIEKEMERFTDYFNGWIYDVTCYDTLENAINKNDSYTSVIYSSDMNYFENSLKEITQ